MKRFLLFLLFAPFILCAQKPFNYVDPMIGTGPSTTIGALRHSAGSEVKGQTFPGVGRPFGMTQWTPETRLTEDKCVSPYYYKDKLISGFRGTHWMSGSCTQDYGSATFMPFATNRIDTITSRPLSRFSHQNETSTPAYYGVLLEDFGIKAELAGTVRSGMLRFSYPSGKEAYLYLRVNSDEGKGKIVIDRENNEIIAYNPAFRIYQGKGQSAGFSGYFVIQFDRPFQEISQIRSDQQMVISFGKVETHGRASLLARIGTSFTSFDAARENLSSEINHWDFDKVVKATEKEWNRTLEKIQVKSKSKDDLIKFYTGLYHCYQLPRIVSDVDGSYIGFAQDTTIHKAEGFDYYDDFSMWDTYRGLHPLMTIIEPGRSLDMIKSLLAKAQQGGWMPIFPAWGNYTSAMIGDHVSTMIADAYLKGIRNFNADTAWHYMRKNAFNQPTEAAYKDGKGRRALQSYLKYNFIPLEDSVNEAPHKREQVSRTLEYALDDYALSQFAKKLGKTDDYEILLKRSQNWVNVIDPSAGYARGRHADGKWVEPFYPFSKEDYICEGTPFQYTWYVPQDVEGLIKILGGREAFISKLDQFFNGNHYWHGNETDQQAPYLYSLAGEPQKTIDLVHRIVKEEYGTGPGGLGGNEDAGQMSAWLVLSMMGFYPVCPGNPEYVTGLPVFNFIKVKTGNGNFRIKTVNNETRPASFSKALLNGKPVDRNLLPHQAIMEGGKLIFQ